VRPLGYKQKKFSLCNIYKKVSHFVLVGPMLLHYVVVGFHKSAWSSDTLNSEGKQVSCNTQFLACNSFVRHVRFIHTTCNQTIGECRVGIASHPLSACGRPRFKFRLKDDLS